MTKHIDATPTTTEDGLTDWGRRQVELSKMRKSELAALWCKYTGCNGYPANRQGLLNTIRANEFARYDNDGKLVR